MNVTNLIVENLKHKKPQDFWRLFSKKRRKEQVTRLKRFTHFDDKVPEWVFYWSRGFIIKSSDWLILTEFLVLVFSQNLGKEGLLYLYLRKETRHYR